MSIPTQHELQIPLLLELARQGGSSKPQNVYSALADSFELSIHERYELKTNDGKEPLWENQVRQTRRILVSKYEIDNSVYGRWTITAEGYKRLRNAGFSFDN